MESQVPHKRLVQLTQDLKSPSATQLLTVYAVRDGY